MGVENRLSIHKGRDVQVALLAYPEYSLSPSIPVGST
jgi:hypothetical protein